MLSAAKQLMLRTSTVWTSLSCFAAPRMPAVMGGAGTRHGKHLAAGTGARITGPGLVTWCTVATLVATIVACSSPPPLPRDCSRFEGATRTPDRLLAPGEPFRVEWQFTNCGQTDWNGYRAVRIEGNFGPEVIPIQAWAPRTTGSIWMEVAAPTDPGRHRLTYQLQGARGPFGTFWTELTVEGQQPPRQP